MRPLILNFKEKPTEEILDYPDIIYNETLNLNICNDTKLPAIEILRMDTETFTKTGGEESDSDCNFNNIFMDTETRTLTSTEESDSDSDFYALKVLMDTSTFTRQHNESTDQDPV